MVIIFHVPLVSWSPFCFVLSLTGFCFPHDLYMSYYIVYFSPHSVLINSWATVLYCEQTHIPVRYRECLILSRWEGWKKTCRSLCHFGRWLWSLMIKFAIVNLYKLILKLKSWDLEATKHSWFTVYMNVNHF